MSGPTQWRAHDRGRVSIVIMYPSILLTLRPLAILSGRAQLMPHLLVGSSLHGHRTVRLHLFKNLFPCIDVDSL